MNGTTTNATASATAAGFPTRQRPRRHQSSSPSKPRLLIDYSKRKADLPSTNPNALGAAAGGRQVQSDVTCCPGVPNRWMVVDGAIGLLVNMDNHDEEGNEAILPPIPLPARDPLRPPEVSIVLFEKMPEADERTCAKPKVQRKLSIGPSCMTLWNGMPKTINLFFQRNKRRNSNHNKRLKTK